MMDPFNCRLLLFAVELDSLGTTNDGSNRHANFTSLFLTFPLPLLHFPPNSIAIMQYFNSLEFY